MRTFTIVVEDGANVLRYPVQADDYSGALRAALVIEAQQQYLGFDHKPNVPVPALAAAYKPAHGGYPSYPLAQAQVAARAGLMGPGHVCDEGIIQC